jgi:hypothetical protein
MQPAPEAVIEGLVNRRKTKEELTDCSQSLLENQIEALEQLLWPKKQSNRLQQLTIPSP